jgi:hypothetical protein
MSRTFADRCEVESVEPLRPEPGVPIPGRHVRRGRGEGMVRCHRREGLKGLARTCNAKAAGDSRTEQLGVMRHIGQRTCVLSVLLLRGGTRIIR